MNPEMFLVDMLGYRYPLPEIPEYRSVEVGNLRIFPTPLHTSSERSILAGYFRTGRYENQDVNWVFMEGKKLWMSMTPMELESAAPHIHHARGRVVVFGLGMGMWVWNILKNPLVTEVTVVEKNPRVVEMLQEALPELFNYPNLSIRVGDALNEVRSDIHYDTLLVDIWPFLGDEKAEIHTREIQSNIRADLVGWWGQELDLVSFASKLKVPTNRQAVRMYESHLGFPIVGANDAFYPKEAYTAAQLFVLSNPSEHVATSPWRRFKS